MSFPLRRFSREQPLFPGATTDQANELKRFAHQLQKAVMKFKLDFKRVFGVGIDRLFAIGLTDPETFSMAVRPILEGHADGDILNAQSLALQGLKDYEHVVRKYSSAFLQRSNKKTSYEHLGVEMAGHQVLPIGTSHGLDVNADGLEVLSFLFSFQTPGPVTVSPTVVGAAPFQEDAHRVDILVPCTFASRGLDYFRNNVASYRKAGGTAVVLAAIIGLPGPHDDVPRTLKEIDLLVESLRGYVDGFVWTPQLAGNDSLLAPGVFSATAARMAAGAANLLKLVELPPCNEAGRDDWRALADAFLTNGGDGIVAVGGQRVGREDVPNPQRWPFESAFRMGGSLAGCRQWAIEELRRTYPKSFIAASGGFHHGNEANRACVHANVIMETEAFTRYGPGIARKMLARLAERLNFLAKKGHLPSPDLHALQQQLWTELGDGRTSPLTNLL